MKQVAEELKRAQEESPEDAEALMDEMLSGMDLEMEIEFEAEMAKLDGVKN